MKSRKIVTVYGTGKGRMEKNKAYQISEVQATGLLAKGVASVKPLKKKEV